MPIVAVVMIVLFVVLVLAVAAYLVRVILILGHVNDQLGKITFGVRSIAHQTQPINGLTESMNTSLGAVGGALGALVDDVTARSDAADDTAA